MVTGGNVSALRTAMAIQLLFWDVSFGASCMVPHFPNGSVFLFVAGGSYIALKHLVFLYAKE